MAFAGFVFILKVKAGERKSYTSIHPTLLLARDAAQKSWGINKWTPDTDVKFRWVGRGNMSSAVIRRVVMRYEYTDI